MKPLWEREPELWRHYVQSECNRCCCGDFQAEAVELVRALLRSADVATLTDEERRTLALWKRYDQVQK